MLNGKNIRTVLVGVSVLIVIISLIISINIIRNFESVAPFGLWKKSYYFYDKTFAPVLSSISKIVPDSKPIVISSLIYGQAKYFINHPLIIPPSAISSNISLVFYMVKAKVDYLLVFENQSGRESLKPLFSKSGIESLRSDFDEIADSVTDYGLRIHLYKVNKAWL